jgi:hypothetical protein
MALTNAPKQDLWREASTSWKRSGAQPIANLTVMHRLLLASVSVLGLVAPSYATEGTSRCKLYGFVHSYV